MSDLWWFPVLSSGPCRGWRFLPASRRHEQDSAWHSPKSAAPPLLHPHPVTQATLSEQQCLSFLLTGFQSSNTDIKNRDIFNLTVTIIITSEEKKGSLQLECLSLFLWRISGYEIRQRLGLIKMSVLFIFLLSKIEHRKPRLHMTKNKAKYFNFYI